jgi:maltose O-acetyltransferase
LNDDARSEREKMLAGDFYRPGDPELAAARARAQALMRDYNRTIVSENDIRGPILDQLLGGRGPGCAIRTPFHVDYGTNIFLGRDVFLNYGVTILDVCRVTIGDMTQSRPRRADRRRGSPARGRIPGCGPREWQARYVIGRNVWIGAAAVVLPGVTVGDDAIIGAGAIVTRDVARGATVVGTLPAPSSDRGVE